MEPKETWTVLFLNAIAIPVIVYWLVANAFRLGGDDRGMLAILVGSCGLGLTIWRMWSALRRQLKKG
jgi:hypothetical protein